MLEFYQKRSWRQVFHSPIALGILIFVCLAMLRVVYDRYSIEREMVARRVEAEVRLESLQTRKAELEKKVEYLSNDRGIEAEMRRNFDVARAGEQVVIILDPEAVVEVQPLQKMGTSPDESAWYQFWR